MTLPNGKQTGRYLRYKLAFGRLDEALVEGWLLEAISLEESIITDRLLSIVGSDGDGASCRQSLSSLIAQAKKAITGSGAPVEGDIFNELDKWRDARNECMPSASWTTTRMRITRQRSSARKCGRQRRKGESSSTWLSISQPRPRRDHAR